MIDLLRVAKGARFLNPRDGVMEIFAIDPTRGVARLRAIPNAPSEGLPVIYGGAGDFAEVRCLTSGLKPDYEEKQVAYRFPILSWAEEEIDA